jgi:hypothetical protein
VVNGEDRCMSDEQVDRAVADNLVGNAATGRLGKAGLRDLGHGHTVCPTRDRRRAANPLRDAEELRSATRTD